LERTAMSDREFRRAEVLRRVLKSDLSLVDAAVLLDMSYRQVQRLLTRMRERGRKGLVHGNLGRPSNRSHPMSERERVLAIVAEVYGGPAEGRGQRFGPTLCAEHLFMDHGILVPVPTLRRWMLRGKLWSRMRKMKKQFKRRDRREHFGELVQLDGSFHDWFEGRGPAGCLITIIDDATGRALGRMNKEETTWDAARVLRCWIEKYGVPKALYVDAKSVFVRGGTVNEIAAGIKPLTQFGRMCQKLGIELIVARTPQAKGRIERNHGTNQDRLIKKMRLEDISDYQSANDYMEKDYFPAHDLRFAVAPQKPEDFHTRLNPALLLEHVFSLEEKRVVGNDWVVRYDNRAFQIEPTNRAKRLTGPKARVLVRETEVGEILIVARSQSGAEHVLEWTTATVATVTHNGGQRFAKPAVARSSEPKPSIEPAGYTRAGKPLSARQMAARAKWDREAQAAVQARIARLAARRSQPVR
jgi:hypothetical protein